MCDYSLESVLSRQAKVGDRLTTRLFRTHTRGFSAPVSAAAICSAVHSPVDARNTPRCQRPTYSCFRGIQRD